MFSYNLPKGLRTKTYKTEDGQIKFDPPVFEQRYMTTIRIIEDQCWKHTLKKVVDFGCSEMRLLPLLRRIPHVEQILEVDLDGELLTVHQQKAVPLVADYLKKRENPLRVEVLQGSITDAVAQLYDVDVVIGLEIIEHLYEDVLEKVPENIFGFIQPKIAIFSTPNSEYNILFGPLLSNGFRHFDHKFEWTQKEFETWSHDICKNYPNYSVAFLGAGDPPPEHKELGYVTQIAVFARNDMIDKPLSNKILKKPITAEAQYKVIYAVNFPFDKDDRSIEQKLLDETNYYLRQSKNNPNYFNKERSIYQIPWKFLSEYPNNFGIKETELLNILKENNFTIEGDYICLPEYDDGDESDDLDYDEEYNLDGQPYRHNLNDEEEEALASNLASGCDLTDGRVTNDTEEENWD